MKLKRAIAVILAAVLVFFAFAGCKKQADEGRTLPVSDLEQIEKNGKIIIGIVNKPPFTYTEDENGEWIGIDADLARDVANKLGVKAEFKVIDANNIQFYLETRVVDCVWSGIPVTDELKKNCSMTKPYAKNNQVLIVPKDEVSKVTTLDELKSILSLTVAVVSGSPGEAVAVENGFRTNSVSDYNAVLRQVLYKTSNVAIVDSFFADAMIYEGSEYESLAKSITVSEGEIAVCCRKNSDLTGKINSLLAEMTKSGNLNAIAQKYHITLS
ncbi:MAG: transporter substrate-binding domain-containing protein [Ruminococcaceae bacterium]|nr:transporter substrate-binding domain-containing protein [Oscillospiraceae bacterium]